MVAVRAWKSGGSGDVDGQYIHPLVSWWPWPQLCNNAFASLRCTTRLKSFLRKTKLTWTGKLRIKVSHEDGRFNLLFNIHCVLLASDANYESHLQYLSEDSRETLSEPVTSILTFRSSKGSRGTARA